MRQLSVSLFAYALGHIVYRPDLDDWHLTCEPKDRSKIPFPGTLATAKEARTVASTAVLAG
jgi:hypothetical protein